MRKSKYFLVLSLVLFSSLVLASCGRSNKLLLLNWGEYLNEDVIAAFEEETGYQIIQDIADSNELFYAKIMNATTVYDLVVPSDYMVDKMYQKGLLQEIDFDKLSNYNLETNDFLDGVKGIQSQMFDGNEKYAMPYFWGTFGLMYNKQVAGLEDAVVDLEWEAYFDPTKRPQGTRVGMYNVSRYAYAATKFLFEEDPNEVNDESLVRAESLLSGAKFTEWGTDTMKKGIVANNLDLAFVYTGDFLDMLYTKLDDGVALEDMTFDIHIPNHTIAFMDFLVIPKKARHLDAAHAFIDFMLRPDMAYLNAQSVGYATPLRNTYDMIMENLESDDPWFKAWAMANQKYYPLPLETYEVKFKGTPLSHIEQNWLDKITVMVNNVKTK